MSPSIHVQPLINVLSPEAIAMVHNSSLRILSEIGIRVDSENAIKLLRKSNGVTLLDDRHVVFHPDTVEWAILQAPSFIDIYNRKRELTFRLGEDRTRFGIGVTNLFYESPDTGEISPFTRENMRIAVGLGNKLSSYDVVSTIGILRNVDPHQADLFALLEMVAGTEKPLIILVSDEKQFKPCLVLLEQLVGNLSTKPFIIPYFNPVTPLVISKATAENMLASIDQGLPLIFSNYGMAGVSTPITSAGTLALLNSELLAGLVFSQLIQPGTPVILGSLPAFFDMKMMLDFYDPQTMLLNLACAEMMDHYHIPHAGTSGSSNGWGADLISAPTLTINHLTCCLGKAGLAPFVGGTHGSKVFSPNLVVYANEIIEQSRQFARGFEVNDETICIDEIINIGIGGNYLSSHQTMKLFKNAYFLSTIFPRLSLEKWQESNNLDPMKFLRERTLDLLNNPLYPEDQAELLSKGEIFITRRMGSYSTY
jgi:trimethylamine--corrinoid protein Co-methyltransferase